MVGLLPGDPILPSFLPLPPSLTSFSLPSSLYLPFTPFLYLASFPSLTLPVALPPCVPTYLPPTPCPFLPSPFFSSFPFPSSLHFTFISPRSSPPPPLLLPPFIHNTSYQYPIPSSSANISRIATPVCGSQPSNGGSFSCTIK